MMNFTLKPAILQIGNYKDSSGGIATQMQNLVQNLNDDNIGVDMVSTAGGIFKRLFVCFSLLFGYNGYAIYHVHGCSGRGFFPVVLGIFAGAVKRKRIVVTYHGGQAAKFLEKWSWFVKFVLSKAQAITVMSNYLHTTFDDYGIATVIVPNTFVPIDIDRKINEKRKLDPPVIVSTRTLSPTYNILNVIKAYQLIKAEYNNAELIIVGDGPDRKKLEKYAAENEIADVRFEGHVQHKGIYEYILRGTAFVSVSHVDNQPFSVLEAFFCGVPVVASKVGGVPDMVKDGTTGILVEPLDVRAIKEGLIKLHKDINLRANIISNALEEVKKYSWTNLKDTWLQIYDMGQ